jgi:RNA polymerase sigma factor (sigma-70 family)
MTALLRPRANWVRTCVASRCGNIFRAVLLMSSVAIRSTGGGAILSLPQHNLGGNEGAGNDYARFRSVVLPHLDVAYNFAHWLTGNRTGAEDVVHDASLRALHAIRGFAGGSARAWTLRIVRNAAYSWLGKNRPAAVATVDDPEPVEFAPGRPTAPDAGTPEAALIAQTDAEHLRAVIAALPTPLRETLVLRDIEGLDYREISEVTEAPIGAVMSRLARARRRSIAALSSESP